MSNKRSHCASRLSGEKHSGYFLPVSQLSLQHLAASLSAGVSPNRGTDARVCTKQMGGRRSGSGSQEPAASRPSAGGQVSGGAMPWPSWWEVVPRPRHPGGLAVKGVVRRG